MHRYPTAQEVAQSLPKCKQLGPGKFKACCPAHDDKTPSLYITQGRERVLFHCFIGCPTSEILDALRGMGVWPEKFKALPQAFGEAFNIPSHEQWDHALMFLSMYQRENLTPDDQAIYDRHLAFYETWIEVFGPHYLLHITDVQDEVMAWVLDNAENGLIHYLVGRMVKRLAREGLTYVTTANAQECDVNGGAIKGDRG